MWIIHRPLLLGPPPTLTQAEIHKHSIHIIVWSSHSIQHNNEHGVFEQLRCTICLYTDSCYPLFFFFFWGGGFAAVLVNNDVFLPKMSIIDSCFWCRTHLVSCAGLYPVPCSFYIETAFLLLVKAELEREKHNIFFFFLLSPVISHLHACKPTRTLLFTQWEWTEMHETFLKSPVIPGKPGCRSLVPVCFTYRNSSVVCTEIIWIS